MKSAPRKTPVTSGRVNSRSASGERAADRESVKLAVPDAMTVQPGRNFRVAGFGVCSVWMNIGGSAAHEVRTGRFKHGASPPGIKPVDVAVRRRRVAWSAEQTGGIAFENKSCTIGTGSRVARLGRL